MIVKINDLKQRILNGLTSRGLSSEEAEIVASPLVQAELMGKRTHGIGKVFMMEDAIKLREGAPKIIKDKGNYALVDGKKSLGHISANFATDLLLKKVKEFDNAIVATINSYYYSMAGVYARRIAEQGYIAIIWNNGGPATITPFGGIDPLLGTNPIAIGIPTENDPIVLDMTTGEKPWGEVNLAKVEQRSLLADTFLDKEGKFTTDPDQVEAIKPFGGYKGYSLNLAFEILTGAFVGAKMGLQSKNAYDLGFLFVAYSPEMFTSRGEYLQKVNVLINEIKNSRKAASVTDIYLPGEKSYRKYQSALQKGQIEIDDKIWQRLNEFESGEDIKTKSGLKQ